MSPGVELKKIKFSLVISLLIPLLLFWVILIFRIPYSITFHFTTYSFGLLVIVLLLYYVSLRLRGDVGVLVGFGLTMLLIALALSYKWTSGFSDNFMVGGLLPYKDAKNYYLGADLILYGLPIEKAGQATERPLFPGFLSSLLMITGQNLKIALAVMVQLAGIGLYVSARRIRYSMGALSASLFITFMYFYIQPLIGYTLSELLGFTLGCFAFVVIWHASHSLKWFDLILGLITLLVAVSARAGAFFIFPMLIIWAGWIFRREKRFSVKAAGYAFIVVLAGYFLVNHIYAMLLGIPAGSAFGNFSYALYGQVRGGTGWHSAIEELGTRNPQAVYRAALQFFLEHPLSLFIGFAKSYRDFFLPGGQSIFAFNVDGWQGWANIVLWVGTMALLLRGLIRLVTDIHLNLASLLVAGFAGVILSIPFLPPIDGGARFYASTMPFFFIIPALGLSQLAKGREQDFTAKEDLVGDSVASRSASVILLALTLIVPFGVYSLGQKPAYALSSCPPEQEPFVMEFHQGSYIDLIKKGTTQCGLAPEVCLSDFEKNNTEKEIDDYYQELLLLTTSNNTNVRIIPAIDLVNEEFHYFYVPHDRIKGNSSLNIVSGCATAIKTKNQSIYQVESILPHED
jgi:hypothetical protein